MPETITAAAILNGLNATQLLADLRLKRGSDIVIDVSAARHLGAQCLQVLLAAKKSWMADGKGFVVTNHSPEFQQGLDLLGAADMLAEDGETS